MLHPPMSHSKAFFIYKPIIDSNNNKHSHFDANILKEALSEALVPFYPCAGRLKLKGDRYEIDCNAKGALFVEVESSQDLADLGELIPSEDLRNIMMPTCDYSQGISSFPLLIVQLTCFKCGSVALGLAQHNYVADGISHLMFNSSWARLAKGVGLGGVDPPVHERIRPREPPLINFTYSEGDNVAPPLPTELLSGGDANTVQSLFKLSREQINKLKSKATQSEETGESAVKLSTYEIVAAHVWRSASKARGLAKDEETNLTMPIDGRSRLKNPALPKGYYGNVLFMANCKTTMKELAYKSLGCIASKVHDTLESMTNEEYLRSFIDNLESKLGLPSAHTGTGHIISIYPNISVNSWGRFPCQEMDFGFGSPTFVGMSNIAYEGQCYLIPSLNGDGSITVAIKLFKSHLSNFEIYLFDF